MAKVKVGTTGKSVFAVLSLLILTAVATIGATLLTSADSVNETVTAVRDRVRREDVQQFLYRNVGWKGRQAEAIMSPPTLLSNDLAVMLKDLPGFWQDAKALERSLWKFTQDTGLLEIPLCKASLREPLEPSNWSKQFDRVRSPIVAAHWVMKPVLEQAEKRGLPVRPASSLPIDALRYFSGLSDETISAVRIASDQVKARPNDWVCIELYLETILALRTAQPNPRSQTDGNYMRFVKALGRDSFGERVGAMTPVEFETYYATENASLTTHLQKASAQTPAKVADWLPALPVSMMLSAYPWLVLLGLLLVMRMFTGLLRALKRSDVEVDKEDPGFPFNLITPVQSDGSTARLDRLFAWTLLAAPALATLGLLTLQLRYARNLAASVSTFENEGAIDLLSGLSSSLFPGPLQWLVCAAGTGLTVIVIRRWEQIMVSIR